VSTYQLAVNLSLSAGGLASGAAMAMASFGNIKQAAAAADASVLSHQKTLDRMNYMGASQGSKTYQYALQQQGQAAGAAAEAHDKLARAQRGANMIGAGVASFGIGMAGADVLKHWITDAGALGLAMNNVRLATGATSAQLDAMQRGDLRIALSNQMDITSVEALRAKAASSGLNDMTKLNALMPELSRFAEVMRATKNYSPEESATTGVQFAHIFQGYQPQQIKPLLDQFARALQTSSATPNEFIHTLSGFAGVAKTMYGSGPGQAQKSSSDAIAMTSLLDNLGQGGRGGTQLRALLLNSMDMISARGAIHNKALNYLEKEAGGSFFDKKGQFEGMANMMDVLMRANAAINNPKNSATIDRAALTAGGAALAGMLGDPAVVDRFKAIRTEVSGKGSLFSLDASQQFVNQTQVGRFNQLQANMETISALMGQKLLPAVVAVATALTQATAGIIDFIDQHPLIAQVAATFVAVGSAIALVAAPILIAAGAFAILSAAGALGTITFAPFLAIALAVVAAVAGLTLLFTHWDEVTKATSGNLSLLTLAAWPFVSMIGSLIPLANAVTLIFSQWGTATKLLGDYFSYLGTQVHDLLLNLQGLPKAVKDVPVLGGAAGPIGGAAGAAAAAGDSPLWKWIQGNLPKITLMPGVGGGYGLGTLPPGYQPSTPLLPAPLARPTALLLPPPPQRYPVPVGGLPARSQGAGAPALGGARQSVAHGPVTNHNNYNVTINTTSDQHARDVAREAVRELERRQSEKMRDLHRYGSLTPSGVELGFHGS